MSLRNLHLLFVTLSALLAGVLAVWALGRFGAGGDVQDALVAGLSILGAIALMAYGIAFRRKSRHW